MDNRKFNVALLVIGLTGLILRVYGFVFALEYDEIWSLENYAGKSIGHIFSDIATPNNHPLNSLQMKCFMNILVPWGIRIVPFLCGVLLIPLIGGIGRRCWNERVGLAGTLLAALSPPLIYYSTVARGYSIQAFLLALAGYALIRIDREKPNLKYALLFLISGILAVLTLATSILYLFPAGLYLLWLVWGCLKSGDADQQKAGWRLFGIATGLALFVALWFGLNLTKFQEFKAWGTTLTFVGFFPWIYALFSQLGIPLLLLGGAGIWAVYRDRRNIFPVVLIVFPLLTAFFTNVGPPRTFIPVILPAVMLMAAALDELYRMENIKLKIGMGIVLAVAIVFSVYANSYWKKVDWLDMFQAVKKIPGDTLVIYDSNDSYPLAWNNGIPVLDDYRERVFAPASQIKQLTVPSENPVYYGMDSSGNVRPVELPAGTLEYRDSFPFLFYRLEPLKDAPVPGELLLIQIRPIPIRDYRNLLEFIRSDNRTLLTCSVWFARSLHIDRQEFRYVLGVLKVNAADKIDFQELENKMRGALSVYRILPLSPAGE